MKSAYRPGVESLEGKALLSGVTLPTVTSQTYHAVSRGVIHAISMLARSGDVERTEKQLENLVARLPQGKEQLLPRWRDDLTSFDPTRRGSAIATRNQMLRELDSHVLTGVKFGQFRFVGPGSARFENTAKNDTPVIKNFFIANFSYFQVDFVLTPKGGTGGNTIKNSLDPHRSMAFDPTIFGQGYTSLEIQLETPNGIRFLEIGTYNVKPPLHGLGILVTSPQDVQQFQVYIFRYPGNTG